MGDPTEEGSVVVVDGGTVDLAAQDCELVSQHDDLQVLRAARAHCEADKADHEAIQGAVHQPKVGPRSRRSRPTTEFRAPKGPSRSYLDTELWARAGAPPPQREATSSRSSAIVRLI